MTLAQVVADYVTLKQALGMRFRTEARILTAFCRALGDVELPDVTPEAVQAYLAGPGPLTTFWHRKYEALTGFYRFAVGRGYAVSSPLPTIVPKRPAPFVPYLYRPEEVQRLLAVTDRQNSAPSATLPPATFRTLLLLLYGTGLRLGEALALTVADVDLPGSLLTIRVSKFYKTRLVPLGPEVTRRLADYAQARSHLPRPAGMASAFLALRTGQPLSRGRAEATFRRLRDRAGVRRTDGARYQPRLHDFRHSFAVRRLVAWYQAGADVQRLLPHLATYLGHADLAATQRYLTLTPELLHAASARFAAYAFGGVS
jgi:site-specific recombinase XerD